MRWRTTCVGMGAAALVSCGGSAGTIAPTDELPLADSVQVMIQFHDAWTDSEIGLTSWVGLSNGAVLRRTDASGVLVPSRGATLEIRIPADEYQSGAIYGPASLTVDIPDTVHANYGASTGLYSLHLRAVPIGLGILSVKWQGTGAVPRLALGVRHANALGTLVLDSIGYFAHTRWNCRYLCDSVTRWVDTAYVGAPWNTTWLAADTTGEATIELPSSRWPTGIGSFLVSVRATLHDSTRRYSVGCWFVTSSIPVDTSMHCQRFAWLTGS